ncbi:MAG: hypothetical protein ACOYBC_04880 [Bilifractor sp.]|jgi:hypothetical protein
MSKQNTIRKQEQNQLIELCAATYFNLKGCMPDAFTLCEMLGNEYTAEVIRYLGGASLSNAGVA